jgi:hypothetical protein
LFRIVFSILGLSFDSSATVHELGATETDHSERDRGEDLRPRGYGPRSRRSEPVLPRNRANTCTQCSKGVEGRADLPALRIAHVPGLPWHENSSQDRKLTAAPTALFVCRITQDEWPVARPQPRTWGLDPLVRRGKEEALRVGPGARGLGRSATQQGAILRATASDHHRR